MSQRSARHDERPARLRTASKFTQYKNRHSALFGPVAAAAITTAATVSPALADTGTINVLSVSPANIEIVSDGSKYIAPAIALVSLSATVNVALDADVSGKVKSWKAWLKAKAPGSFSVQFSDDGYSKSYPLGSRPKSVDTNVALSIPYGSLAPYATGQCNNLANSLRGQGLSESEIFGQDRVIVVGVSGALSYEMTGLSGVPVPPEVVPVPPGVQTGQSFNLVCKASNPTRLPSSGANNPTRNIPDVSQAFLSISEAGLLNGACNLTLSGVIVTKDANTQVKFRYKDDEGNQSSIKTVKTDHTKTVNFVHNYALSGTGNKQGKIRIAIASGNVSSPWSDYNVDCLVNAPGGVVGNDSVRISGVAEGAATGVASQNAGNGTLPSRALPGKTARPGTPGPGGLKTDSGQADLMATPLGMSLAGGPRGWGSHVVIDNPAHATVKGIGVAGNLCRFWPAAFRPFNKGTVKSGPFAATIYRDNQPVHSANFDLDPKKGLPSNSGWYRFNLELPQGTSQIKLVLDPKTMVAESDEGNNVYLLTVTVNYPCTNNVRTAPSGIKASPSGGIRPGAGAPRKPDGSLVRPQAAPPPNRR